MLSHIDDVRRLGNLPDIDELPDDKVRPHMEAAGRELTQRINDYSRLTGDNRANAMEAECCLCMYYLLPGLNILYTEGIPTAQTEIGESNIYFQRPEDLKLTIEYWLKRAEQAISRIGSTDGISKNNLRIYEI